MENQDYLPWKSAGGAGKINLRQMKNRLQQIEKSLGAERKIVLRQVILSFQPTDFMQIRTK